MTRSSWSRSDTRLIRAAIPRIVRSGPLTASQIRERLCAVFYVADRKLYRALRWCIAAGSVRHIGAFRNGQYVEAVA